MSDSLGFTSHPGFPFSLSLQEQYIAGAPSWVAAMAWAMCCAHGYARCSPIPAPAKETEEWQLKLCTRPLMFPACTRQLLAGDRSPSELFSEYSPAPVFLLSSLLHRR